MFVHSYGFIGIANLIHFQKKYRGKNADEPS